MSYILYWVVGFEGDLGRPVLALLAGIVEHRAHLAGLPVCRHAVILGLTQPTQ